MNKLLLPSVLSQTNFCVASHCYQHCGREHRTPWGLGKQGWRSGESTRLPPIRLRFDSRNRRHMWVEFVVSSHPCSERFILRVLRFSLFLKKQHSNSIWIIDKLACVSGGCTISYFTIVIMVVAFYIPFL